MATRASTNGHSRNGHREETPYEKAVLGFRNYWHPVTTSSEVGEKPKDVKVMNEAVALLRRQGKVYAIADECAHRGTPLSVGKYEFPGTNTITCRYHGWTYDVTNGACVAVLCEGPDSQVPGKIRIKTYPVEEFKGIVWLWMGRMAPVPIKEDMPALFARDDTHVRVRHGVKYGNWRWHAENVGGGHAQVLHRDTIGLLFQQFPSHPVETTAVYSGPEDDDGTWLLQGSRGSKAYDEYPGLGTWPRPRPWRRSGGRPKPAHGISNSGAALHLPGFTRVANFPVRGWLYYEWYTPVDEDHYIYFQVSTFITKNPVVKALNLFKYYTYGKLFKVTLFNNQDVRMVKHTTDYTKRKGMDYLTPLTRQDLMHIEWRKHASEWARGEGTAWRQASTSASGDATREAEAEPAIAGGSE